MSAPEPGADAAPAERPRRWWSAIPRRLGRARTSTVVLAVLFVAIGILYLYVRPEPAGTAPARDTRDVPSAPVEESTPPPEPTTTPTTDPRPTGSAPATDTDDPTPTEDDEPTTGPGPTGETSPDEDSEAPTTSRPTTTGGSSAPTS